MSISKYQWDGFVKILAVATALSFLVISAQFSVDGFDIEMPDQRWVGWLMSCGLIVLELVFNRMLKDTESSIKQFPMLFAAGVLSYIYGIYTNVVGINAFSGFEIHGFQQFVDTIGVRPIHSLIGVVFEVVPEGVLIWAITAKGSIFKPKEQAKQEPKYTHRDVRPELQQKLHHNNQPKNKNKPVSRVPFQEPDYYDRPAPKKISMRDAQQPDFNFDALSDFLENGQLESR